MSTTPLLEQAKKLDDVYKTLSAEPLLERAELDAFYRSLYEVRGGDDVVHRLALQLERAWGGVRHKALVVGHSGVGKSTELARLAAHVQSRFRARRFSVAGQLDPISFKPFDVLLLMVAEIAEATAKPQSEGGAGQKPSDDLVRGIWDWFAGESDVLQRSTRVAAEAAAGAGLSPDSWWAKALGLFGTLRGEMKYASVRTSEVVSHRLSRLDDLIRATNRLFSECNRLLRKATGCEFLLIGEEFDRMGVSPDATEDFFVTYGNVIRDLDAHLIFTIPTTLAYSSKAVQLTIPRCFIPDTMVFDRQHRPHTEGRAAVGRVLEARVSPKLFADGQIDRLIVASAGNLRELFRLTGEAADNALLRKAPSIGSEDVGRAIAALRTEYERRLGESSFDKLDSADYEKKAERLLRIYDGVETAKVPDAVLYSLLRARVVQEFDGERWFGVHPLVVDILGKQGKLDRNPDGTLPGGTS